MMRWLLLLIAFPLLSHAAVERLVTLGGDVTEIVYALHAEESLVARDSTSSWPPAAQKLPDVGYLRQLNAEGILALRPQLVLASAQAQPSLVLHKVQASGVKVVNVPGGENLAAIQFPDPRGDFLQETAVMGNQHHRNRACAHCLKHPFPKRRA